ncbi:MAG: hypothetical protein K2H09_02295, partial [Treponemataceae bacterium]|nr:hypothetical protein [Treponemataceae bacterium]
IVYDYYANEFDGNSVYRLAADGNYLYALSYTPHFDDEYSRNVPTEIHLWYTDGTAEWKKIEKFDPVFEAYRAALRKKNFMMDANIALFCTNTPQTDHRKAYIRIGGGSTTAEPDSDVNKTYGAGANKGVIELDGPYTDPNGTIPEGTQGAGLKTVSAVYFKEDYILLDHLASTTDETADKDADYLYFADGETLYYIDGGSYTSGMDFSTYKEDGSPFKSGNIDTGTILSMTPTANSLLFGTHRSGVYNITLVGGKPAEDDKGAIIKAKHLEVSGSSILESPYIVRTILCTDPSVEETAPDSAIYCSLQFQYTAAYSSTSYDNVGLWSYYEARGNWNRE